MKTLKIKTYDIHIIINSIIIAIMCTSNLLFYYFIYYVNYNSGFLFIMGVAFALLLISLFLHRSISKSDLASVSILLCLILGFYLICNMIGRIGSISVISFIGFSLFPIICSLLEKNVKIVLECIMVISLFALPISARLFEYQFVTLLQIDMSKAYAVFVTVSASIIHFCWYRKNCNILIKITYIVNLYLLFKLLNVGNRGIIASFVFLIFILLFRYTRQSDISDVKKRMWSTVLIIFGILAVLVALNGERIIVYLYDYFNSSGGMVPSFVIKMYKLIVYKSDISNGRDEVYNFFIRKIIENPITGYGMKMSSTVSGGIYPYPHNYILQMLFEGGILFAVYPTIISFKMILITVFKKSNVLLDEVFYVFLICNCIPKLLVSGDIWSQPILWLWLGTAATQFTIRRKKDDKQAAATH